MSWKQEWWYYLLSSVVVLYVGVKGYFTPVLLLKPLGFSYENFSFKKIVSSAKFKKAVNSRTPEIYTWKIMIIQKYMKSHEPFLNSELTLAKLATQLNMARDELSEAINNGLEINFNDFVNFYRVTAVKKFLSEKGHDNLSLEGVAYECGFNSKANFYRAFKKQVQVSPSKYLLSLKS